MNESNGNLEQISELMDGRLHAGALVDAVHQACTEPAAAQAWRSYHLVGDVLRSPDLGLGHDPDFLRRLRVRLDEQPVAGPAQASESTMPVAGQAANADFFAWKKWAGWGVAAAVGVLAWNLGWQSETSSGTQLAHAPVPAPVLLTADAQGPTGVMLRDPRMDQLIQAHRQSGAGSALQLPTAFLRNATYQLPTAVSEP